MTFGNLRLRTLSLPARLLVTGFLLAMALGFVAAQVNLRLRQAGLDGEAGLSYDDVVFAFHGKPGSTLLTTKIDPGGSMHQYIPQPEDRETVHDWVGAGAPEHGFEPVQGVMDRLCIRCHHPGGQMPQVAFATSRAAGASYDRIEPLTLPDRGMSRVRLAQSSHAHLFGMGVLFALAGGVFLLTDAGGTAKGLAVSLPFAALFLDVGCWWLTKADAVFAYGVIAGGVLLAVAFAVLILRPLWELWGPRPKETPLEEVARDTGPDGS